MFIFGGLDLALFFRNRLIVPFHWVLGIIESVLIDHEKCFSRTGKDYLGFYVLEMVFVGGLCKAIRRSDHKRRGLRNAGVFSWFLLWRNLDLYSWVLRWCFFFLNQNVFCLLPVLEVLTRGVRMAYQGLLVIYFGLGGFMKKLFLSEDFMDIAFSFQFNFRFLNGFFCEFFYFLKVLVWRFFI